ncbi:MAG: hypothetical protein COA47_12055 [Robiginitomaculum sp.]|nr:MAG: hypothetical protein COA47_12055 [Robiginitomaculum sp.]
MTETPFSRLVAIADQYGALSFENYALVRSLAERLRDGFCGFLSADDGTCVYLVPPTGPFSPQNHGSAAYSVSGGGFLPLAPISFGLAVRVSKKADWLRVVFHCGVEGGELQIYIEGGDNFDLPLPFDDSAVEQLFEPLYRHIHDWFADRVKQYQQGSYGSREIGFEIINAASDD